MSDAARIAAIPTKYAGVRFRSRLEARWAAMFDLMKWPWSYEPADFVGWIPDFLLMGHVDLLVEVKQARSILDDKAQEAVMKIWRSAPPQSDILLLGIEGAAWLREPGHPAPDIGRGSLDPWRVGWGEGCIGRVGGGRIDIWHFWGSPVPRIHGPDIGARLSRSELAALWREAGNKVQWKAA